MENRLYYYSLSISLFLHLAILVVFSIFHPEIFKKPLKQIEVTYFSLSPKTVADLHKQMKSKDLKVLKRKDDIAKKLKVIPKEYDPASQVGKNLRGMTKLTEKFDMDKKQAPQIKTLDRGGKITVPMMKSEKITNVRYLNYYQNIRQIIKERAYTYEDHPDLVEGDVYLSFVLSSDGRLKDVKVLKEKTSAGSAMQNIGLRIIKESSPFPPFSKDLNYPELTFNVVISFEIK